MTLHRPFLFLIAWTIVTAFAGAADPRPILVLPFDLYDRRIWLTVQVNGNTSADFQFDSAAGASCVNERMAERIGLKPAFIATANGAGDGSQTIGVAQNVDFGIGSVTFRPERTPLIDFDLITKATGRQTDGLIGREFLERYVVAFDYDSRTMSVYEPQTFEYRGGGKAFPIEVIAGGPVLRAAVHMPGRPPIPARLLLDAPHTGAVVLTTPFVDRHNLLEAAAQLTPKLLSGVIGGVGGESSELFGRIRSLEIGPYSFDLPVTGFSRAKGGTLASSEIDGLVGAQIIGRFRIIYDYTRRRVILEPGKSLAGGFEHDMSGMQIYARTVELKATEVVRVTDGTPAAEAGIRKGDILLTVNGRPVQEFKIPDLRNLLKKDGEVIHLKLRRGEVEKTVTLKLRRLV